MYCLHITCEQTGAVCVRCCSDKCEDDALRQAEETLRRYDTNRDLRVSWHELAHAHFDSPAELVLDPPADLTAFVNVRPPLVS